MGTTPWRYGWPLAYGEIRDGAVAPAVGPQMPAATASTPHVVMNVRARPRARARIPADIPALPLRSIRSPEAAASHHTGRRDATSSEIRAPGLAKPCKPGHGPEGGSGPRAAATPRPYETLSAVSSMTKFVRWDELCAAPKRSVTV